MKYQHKLCDIEECPPKNVIRPDFIAYRFVHEELSHKNNFSPAYEIKPSRALCAKNARLKCSGYALSFFQNFDQACNKMKKFCRNVPKFRQIAGDSIAIIDLKPDDGLATMPNHETHFDLHPFRTSCLVSRVIDVKKVLHGTN